MVMSAFNPRLYHTQQIHYLRRNFSFADGNGTVMDVGAVPAGSLILKPLSGVAVLTAFNAGTSNVLDLGTTATANLFGASLSLASINGLVPTAQTASFQVATDIVIQATLTVSGTAATTGTGVIIVAYIPNNDR